MGVPRKAVLHIRSRFSLYNRSKGADNFEFDFGDGTNKVTTTFSPIPSRAYFREGWAIYSYHDC